MHRLITLGASLFGGVGLLMLAVPVAQAGPPPPLPPPSGAGSVEPAPAPAPSPAPAGGPPPSASAPQPSAQPSQPAQPGLPPTPAQDKPVDPFAQHADMSATQDLTDTWGYSGRRGDVRPNYVRSAADVVQVNPIGFYSGVALDNRNAPPFPPKSLGSGPATLTWTGFQRTVNGSRVFFQVSSAIQHSMSRDGLVVRVRMSNTSLNVKNNARRLDLRFFRTPVLSVSVRKDGGDAVATINLKREAAAKAELVEAANGYKMLVISFPK